MTAAAASAEGSRGKDDAETAEMDDAIHATSAAPCRKKVRLETQQPPPRSVTRSFSSGREDDNQQPKVEAHGMLVVTPKTASCHKLQKDKGSSSTAAAFTPAVASSPSTSTPFVASTATTTSTDAPSSVTQEENPPQQQRLQPETACVPTSPPPPVVVKSEKRTNYLSWDDYFMALVLLSGRTTRCTTSGGDQKETVDDQEEGRLSTCGMPKTATRESGGGVCIVDNATHRILAIGQPDTSMVEKTPTKKVGCSCCASLSSASCWWRNHPVAAGEEGGGARLYTYDLPCPTCTEAILGQQEQDETSPTRIQQVVYQVDATLSGDPENDTSSKSRALFRQAKVQVRQYQASSSRSTVDIDFYDETGDDRQEPRHRYTNHSENDDAAKASATAIAPQGEDGLVDTAVGGHAIKAALDPLRAPSSWFLSWDDYCMAVSLLTAKRSKDPNTQVGAVIVDDVQKQIVGVGYNGFPIGCSDDHLPWARKGPTPLHTKYLYVVHAEVNAVLNKCGEGTPSSLSSLTLYAALFPCNDCAKVIIQAGIRQVVYTSDRYHNTDACRASRILFRMAGVKLRQYVPTFPSVRISLLEGE